MSPRPRVAAITPGMHSADRLIDVVQIFEFAMSCLWKCPYHHDGKQLTERQQRHHPAVAPARIEEHAGTQQTDNAGDQSHQGEKT